MTANASLVSPTTLAVVHASLQALDARTLGRPVHLLGRFSDQLRDDFGELLRNRFNLRYRARFEVEHVGLRRNDGDERNAHWLAFGSGASMVCCAIDRDVVLSVMAYRYGLRAALSANGEAQRETATEERLANQLAQSFVALLNSRLDAGLGTALGARSADAPLPAAQPSGAIGGWRIEARVREPAHGIAGSVHLTLGEASMAAVWRALAPLRIPAAAPPEQAAPLATRLAFRVVARLLHKEIPLCELAELRVGDVIPISLGATDVLIDDARLFTAAVAEHQGKLCLTSFADVE